MLALEVIVAIGLLVGVAFVASHDFAGLEDPDPDVADIGLPADRPLRSDDIGRLKFRVVSGWRGGARGYRFADVDAVMDQVEAALRTAEGEKPGASDTAQPAGPTADVDPPPGG